MSNINQMPREEGIDHSLSLMREGYMYILNRRHSFNSDIFETRLLGKKAICMGGKEAKLESDLIDPASNIYMKFFL